MPAAASFGAVGELAASRHGAFTRRQAADIGMGHMTISRHVRRGVLTEPAPGVLVVSGARATVEQQAYIATLAGGGHGLIVSEAAARLHMVVGLVDHDGVLVAIPRGGRMPLVGVTATQRREHYDDQLDVIAVLGIPCISFARTVADLARYRPDAYERAADDFQRRGFSLDWLEQTLRRVPRRRGDGLTMAFATSNSAGRVAPSAGRGSSGSSSNASTHHASHQSCASTRCVPRMVISSAAPTL